MLWSSTDVPNFTDPCGHRYPCGFRIAGFVRLCKSPRILADGGAIHENIRFTLAIQLPPSRASCFAIKN